ncbi:tRNA dimethylallyltransferase isoform X1 [Neodiprion pinetum]|uniref:tRNA dimethylallyltransferase isoform X1 n=1 Tax=Neodiprion pinetum TaxID=441929 RepID=UPI001EDE79C6|nr:tRNA dimethylallyltransferase isoform X1 [Neodiprion pinetum]
MTSRVPILVILGATGTGKSKLAIQLAQKYCGEIISADSMQVYKGLDVITAKVTKEEQAMAPHHMLDVVDPLSTFSVVDFRNRALPVIDKLLSVGKVPIIVGGTNYYIESLLWQVLIEDPKDTAIDEPCSSLVFDRDDGFVNMRGSDVVKSDRATSVVVVDDENRSAVGENRVSDVCESETQEYESADIDAPASKKIKFDDAISTDELHRKLREVDATMADRLHPNDRRKIIRSLQVFDQFGTKHSEILREQQLAGGSGLGGPLRYHNSVILWLQCDQNITNQCRNYLGLRQSLYAVLDKRLDHRVDSMLKAGLVEELLDFHRRYNEGRIKENALPDYTKGIFQSIGFKEFHDYLILPEDQRSSDMGEKLLKLGIENLKLRTRRYARRQQRWVTNRFIRRFDRQVPPVYPLDCTDVAQWDQKVLGPAMSIITDRLEGQTPSHKSLNNNKTENFAIPDSNTERTRYCETCERVFVGDFQWKAHMEGKKHQRVAKRKKINQLMQDPK